MEPHRAFSMSPMYTVLPSHCGTYYGPHSLECLETLWLESGCLIEGHATPSNLTADRLASLGAMNIGYDCYYT